jgi:hypothetical protein
MGSQLAGFFTKSALKTSNSSSSGAEVPVSLLSLKRVDDLDVTLGPGDVKKPDGHFCIRRNLIIPQNLVASFPTDPITGSILPGLVFEVSFFNESLPAWTEDDTARWFAPGGGTRIWLGFKIHLDTSGAGRHTWWCGMMIRDYDLNTNTWLNTATLDPTSFPRVRSNDRLMSIPVVGQVFQVDVAKLLHPVPLPRHQAPHFTIDLEAFRLHVVKSAEQ